MRNARENPDSTEMQAAQKQNEREIFALKMQASAQLAEAAESSGCAWTDLRAHWAASAKNDPDYRTPEERVLLLEMFQRYESLRKAGWQDIIYCPKDGTSFLSISAGSTGVHSCHYEGEWPKGSWWISEAGDMWPAYPILWKPIPGSPNARALPPGKVKEGQQ